MVRDEIVSFGTPGELRGDADGIVGCGERLSPTERNSLVAARGDIAEPGLDSLDVS